MSAKSSLTVGTILWGLARFVLLVMLFFVFFAMGGSWVAPALPNTVAEPGPVSQMTGVYIVSAASALVVILMILSSRWHGWKLMLTMSVTYYVMVTFLMQIEAWYFLYGLTIGPDLMPLLFLQGIPVAFVFVPLAVIILGRARKPKFPVEAAPNVPRPIQEWGWKLAVIALAYLVLYYGAGYFIAWQNPVVRAFYGETGDIRPFFGQMIHIFTNDPWLTPFQILRSMIWVVCALPVLCGSRWPLWATALIVGLMFSVPQNIGHLMPNSLIPINSVRISHLIETASSTFIFGLMVGGLLYPKHREVREPQPQTMAKKVHSPARE